MAEKAYTVEKRSSTYYIFGSSNRPSGYPYYIELWATTRRVPNTSTYTVELQARHYCEVRHDFTMSVSGTCGTQKITATIPANNAVAGWSAWSKIWTSSSAYSYGESPTISVTCSNAKVTSIVTGVGYKLSVPISMTLTTGVAYLTGKPSKPTWLTVSSPIYYNETYYMSAPTEHTQYRYRETNGTWNDWKSHGSSTYGSSSKPSNAWEKSAVQWRVRNYDTAYETPASDWYESSQIVYSLRPPTIKFNSTVYYGKTFGQSAGCTFPSNYPAGTLDDWQWKYSTDGGKNYAEYPASGTNHIQDSSAQAIKYSHVKLRARVYHTYLKSSEWSSDAIAQVTLNAVNGFSLSSPVYYHQKYGDIIKITENSNNPSNATHHIQYQTSDDGTNWNAWIKSEQTTSGNVLTTPITHPYIRLCIQYIATNYKGSAWIYAGNAGNQLTAANAGKRQVTLNPPSSLEFSPNPVTTSISKDETGSGIVEVYELETNYSNTPLSSDVNDLKIPSQTKGTKLHIKNSVDKVYQVFADNTKIKTYAKYNGATAEAYYSCPGYIDSSTVATSTALTVKTAPKINSNFQTDFYINGTEALQSGDTVVLNKDTITVEFTNNVPASNNQGLFNYYRIKAIKTDGTTEIIQEGYTDTYKKTTGTTSITIKELNKKLSGGSRYQLKLIPCCYRSGVREATDISSSASLSSETFLCGEPPYEVNLLYPSIDFSSSTVQLATVSNRLPLCFKLPNPGSGSGGLSEVSIECRIIKKSAINNPDSAKVISKTSVSTTGSSPSSAGLRLYYTKYNTNNKQYTTYNHTSGTKFSATDIKSGMYITAAFDITNDFVQTDAEESYAFYYIIKVTNDLSQTTTKKFVIERLNPIGEIHAYKDKMFSINHYSHLYNIMYNFINYYQSILGVSAEDFAKEYTRKSGDIITYNIPKTWLETFILGKLINKKSSTGTGGFPHINIGKIPNSNTINYIKQGSEISTDIDTKNAVIADLNLKTNLQNNQGMYYDIILKMFVDNI